MCYSVLIIWPDMSYYVNGYLGGSSGAFICRHLERNTRVQILIPKIEGTQKDPAAKKLCNKQNKCIYIKWLIKRTYSVKLLWTKHAIKYSFVYLQNLLLKPTQNLYCVVSCKYCVSKPHLQYAICFIHFVCLSVQQTICLINLLYDKRLKNTNFLWSPRLGPGKLKTYCSTRFLVFRYILKYYE